MAFINEINQASLFIDQVPKTKYVTSYVPLASFYVILCYSGFLLSDRGDFFVFSLTSVSKYKWDLKFDFF